MKRRINLYTQPPKEPFLTISNLSGALSIAGILIGLFLLIGIGLTYYALAKENELTQLTTEKQQLTTQVEELQHELSSRKAPSQLLENQIKLKNQLAMRKVLGKLLSQLKIKRNIGFSTYMHGLALAAQPASWLTEFQIDIDKKQIMLSGQAEDAADVPVLLEAIGQTDIFKGISFTYLNIESIKPSGDKFKTSAELPEYE